MMMMRAVLFSVAVMLAVGMARGHAYTSNANEVTTPVPYTSSIPNEVTTAAPYTSSNPNEVTTPAPYTSSYTSSSPNEVTTPAPTGLCGWVYIDAQFVLSGAGWLNVQGNVAAWAALPAALVSDLASLLGRTADQINIESITAASNALTVVFTARSNALAEAARIAALIRDDVPASAPLPATLGVYASVGGQSSADVTVASHTATSRDVFDSTCAASSNGNEVTTAAPYTSSSPNEVTTAAPYTSAPYTSSSPNEVTTPAPYTPAPYTSSSPNEVTTAAPYTTRCPTPPPVTVYARLDRTAKAAAVDAAASASAALSHMWALCAVVGLATAVFVV
jgi:hypothetical protein